MRMKKIYLKAVLFWFMLLAAALINAAIRETTYKPILTPYIGIWAHQISSLTGIILFYICIYCFLKRLKTPHTRWDLVLVGALWILMTVVFESLMNAFIRKLSFDQVLQTYYFWRGDTWIFVLFSLVVSPLVADSMLKKEREKLTVQ